MIKMGLLEGWKCFGKQYGQIPECVECKVKASCYRALSVGNRELYLKIQSDLKKESEAAGRKKQ